APAPAGQAGPLAVEGVPGPMARRSGALRPRLAPADGNRATGGGQPGARGVRRRAGGGPGAAMIELTGHKGLVVALAYSPDGRTLASASADGTARLWDLATGRLVATLQSPADRAHCVAFAPDGKSLAVGYGGPHGFVQVWDLNPLRRRDSWARHN